MTCFSVHADFATPLPADGSVGRTEHIGDNLGKTRQDSRLLPVLPEDESPQVRRRQHTDGWYTETSRLCTATRTDCKVSFLIGILSFRETFCAPGYVGQEGRRLYKRGRAGRFNSF